MTDPEAGPGFPLQNTRAAQMLRRALERVQREERVSIRSLAKRLAYKQATVLSHMASGRVPIPLERAPEIARAVGLPPADFLAACVEQRSPEAGVLLRQARTDPDEGSYGLIYDLRAIAESELDELNDDQKSVLREVVSDPKATRRWLTLAELPLVALIREVRPDFSRAGLDEEDIGAVGRALRSRRTPKGVE